MDILARVRLRTNDVYDDALLEDLVQTVTDRLCIRLGVQELPQAFESIAADAAVKAARRVYYEGIQSEGAANISTAFVADILSEYDAEIERYRADHAADVGNKTIRFY